MQMAQFFTNNKSELGLTPATKNIMMERKKYEELDLYNPLQKKDSQWIKKAK